MTEGADSRGVVGDAYAGTEAPRGRNQETPSTPPIQEMPGIVEMVPMFLTRSETA